MAVFRRAALTNIARLSDEAVPTQLGSVPSWLVHKLDPAANLVDTVVQVNKSVVQCQITPLKAPGPATQLEGGREHPLTLVEAFRQSVIATCHAVYGVPLTSAFAMKTIGIEVFDPETMENSRDQGSIYLTLSFTLNYRDETLASSTVEVSFARGGAVFARGRASLALLPPKVYDRVRQGAVKREYRSERPRLAAGEVGAVDDASVLLGAARRSDSWPIALDTGHPGYFDHPADHVPGMLVLEAIRQAVHAAGAEEAPTVWAAEFHRYVELEASLDVRVTRSPCGRWEATVLADGEPAVTALAHSGQKAAAASSLAAG